MSNQGTRKVSDYLFCRLTRKNSAKADPKPDSSTLQVEGTPQCILDCLGILSTHLLISQRKHPCVTKTKEYLYQHPVSQDTDG